MLDPAELENVKAGVPIVGLVGRDVRLRKTGKSFTGLCPFHAERTPSFHVFPDHYHCFGCGAHGDAVAWVMQRDRLSFLEAVDRLRTLAGSPAQPRAETTVCRSRKDEPKASAENTPRALQIFDESGELEKSPLALTYLEARRRIKGLPPDVHELLRFHPRCQYGPDFLPCIVALMRNIITNKPQAIYRTALTPDAKKLERARALGPSGGAAIKLWPDEDVELGLVAGEGFETTLAAAMMIEHRGTLLRPAWALGSSGNLADFPVLPGIEALTILADHDENDVGQQAAAECAKRWVAAGREVIRLTPQELGHDFNNIILDGEAP